MDIETLLRDHGVQFITEGSKHCRPGWLNMPCPFCVGNEGHHLGVSINKPHFKCWRCGWKPLEVALGKLIGCSEYEARQIVKKYAGTMPTYTKKAEDAAVKIGKHIHKLPSGTGPCSPQHIAYLVKRQFDPSIVDIWQLHGTGPVGELDGISYKLRLVAPIFWEGKRVSFQARDITNKADLKYITCPMEREVVHHKHIVYCHPEIDWALPIVVVEGITDVWRLGKQAVATFGIEFKNKQLRAICQKKRAAGDNRVAIMYDDDPQAIIQAAKMHAELAFRGMSPNTISIQGDPGGMPQAMADDYMRRIGEWQAIL